MESSTKILDPSYEKKVIFQGSKDEDVWIKKIIRFFICQILTIACKECHQAH